MRPTVAVTGATGFIGRHVVRRLCDDGWRVRILARRPVEPSSFGAEVEVVRGALDDRNSLERLLYRAAAVVHVAGLIKARSRDAFFRANADGVAHLVEVAASAPTSPHFMLISSLAAREPGLSDYAASKRRGEYVLTTAGRGLSWTILRPPAVYGPGDRATLTFFRCVRHGIGPVLGTAGARLSLLHVQDLADAVGTMLGERRTGLIAEIDDGQGGYGWPEMIEVAAEAFGRRARMLRVPMVIPYALGWLNRALMTVPGYTPMLTPGKVRELYHRDWVCDIGPLMTQSAWRPKVPIAQGFASTVEWYRQQGWL